MNIAEFADTSGAFHLLETTGRSQTAVMTLKRGEATSDEMEAHPHSDQVVLVLEGEVMAEAGIEHTLLKQGQA